MKSRSEQPEPSKVAATAGVTPARREPEVAGARASTLTRDSTLESAFERSISTTRPAPLQAIDLSLNVVTHGKLTWRTVLAWLRDDKIVSLEDVERTARRFAGGNSAQHPLVRIGSAGLTRLGDGKVLDTETLTEWLAKRSKLPYMRIDPLKVDVGRVADVMSIQYAERRHALPLTFGLTEVTIATCEPLDTGWVAEIEAHTRRSVKLVVVNPIEIARYTTEFYALSRSVRNATKMGESAALANFEQLVELGKSSKQLDANDSGVIQVVDWLWQYAFDQRASDIHLEPRRERSVIRFRIDGVMHTVYQLPPGVMSAMVARVKVLGRMDVVEKRRPLDGRIKVRNPAGDEVEMRLSTLPTAFGEKMVMRIFDPDTTVKTLESLGFGNHDGRRWEELVAKPHGIILVTGPTGSGKTTTLYSTLRRLATDEVNVCTIEDPIEMIQPAFNQTQVQTQIDLNFSEGLRSLMRQDPDIIMVGEIRDLQTADMAIQASLTGHLVFSTLHTNDSASAITRLNDLGVAPYLIGSTLIGVLAQRLVRTLCPACKKPDPEVTRETLHEVVKPWRLNGGVRPYQPVGCLECRMTGYRGRAGLFELLTISDAARCSIQPVCDEAKLRQQALQDGLRPLRLAGAMKVAEGVTTLDEVLRATPAWE
jgi:general secretion pathway protein E